MADLYIRRVRAATATEWDRAWSVCPHATYFHGREWADVWAAATREQVTPCAQYVEFSDGTTAVLPASVRSGPPLVPDTWMLSPAGTYGGWISDSEAVGAEHSDLLVRETSGLPGRVVWRHNPYNVRCGAAAFGSTQTDETHALDLREGFDAVSAQWNRGQKGKIRKARREGVEVRFAQCEGDWRAYYDNYLASQERWGKRTSPRYGWELFEALCDRGTGAVALWLAELHGEAIAGAVIVSSAQHSIYWHGAALAQHFKLRAVNLLMADAIRYACERGQAWFDFNPSGGHDGVAAFKQSFGAKAMPCPVTVAQSPVMALAAKIAQRVRRVLPA